MSSKVLTTGNIRLWEPLDLPHVQLHHDPVPPAHPVDPLPSAPTPSLAELQSRIEESEEERQKHFEAGIAEGLRQAAQKFEAERSAVLTRLFSGVSHLDQWRADMQRESERDLVRLSMAIARRVLHRELSIDGTALQGIARAALERLNSADIVRVRTHPQLLDCIRTMIGQRAELQRIQIEADTSLQPGDLLFETHRGVLDASIDTQLREIETGLVDRLENR